MRLLDARVYHLDKDARVVMEFDHELLVLLHVLEAVLVDKVGVVEEHVVFACQFDLDVLDVVWFTL